jgi:membrane protease YdiL (CAAX protease family)
MILLYIWSLRFRHPRSWTIILALVLASHAFRNETAAELGFNRKNLKWLLEAFAPMVLLLALAILGIAAICGDIRKVTPESGFSSLVLYCVWGLFQQYVLNGYFVNRLVEFSPSGAPLLAALIFSGAHMPNWFLMIVTAAGGFVCAKLYLKFRNLYFLGLAHGAIGFLLYLCVPDTISHHLYVGPKWFS